MGYMAHHAVLIHISGYAIEGNSRGEKLMPDLAAFRAALPEKWQRLLIGPVEGVVNGDYSVAFLPDGSKEGWRDSDDGDRIRRELMDLFSFRYEDGSSPFDVVEVRFGGDDPMDALVLDQRFGQTEQEVKR